MSNNNNWVSTTDNAIGQQLLEGGKALMKNIYNLDPNGTDYQPGSYTKPDNFSSLTDYEYHVDVDTNMYWTEQLSWECVPAGKQTGTVSSIQTGSVNNPDSKIVSTDCSGFITGLFTYCNNVGGVDTKFGDWQLKRTVPQAKDFFKAFGKKDFDSLNIDQIEPGDLIAFTYHENKHKDSGHIMLIVATQSVETNRTDVIVMDVTKSPHTSDTRGDSAGLGMGIGQLFLDTSGVLHFYWGTDNGTDEYPVALGRAL